MIRNDKEHGKAAFIHGNSGRKPATSTPLHTTERILELYQTKYYGADFSYFTQLLAKHEQLHLAIDDATGRITGAWFVVQETLDAYYHVFHQILTSYGIPYKFLTDCRTVLIYKCKNSPSLDEDTYTQFAYACKQLGVELESSSVPQRKGRVERLDQTLQSRLPIE